MCSLMLVVLLLISSHSTRGITGDIMCFYQSDEGLPEEWQGVFSFSFADSFPTNNSRARSCRTCATELLAVQFFVHLSNECEGIVGGVA